MATMVLVQDGKGSNVALVPLSRAVGLWLKQSATVIKWFKNKVLWMGPEINKFGKRVIDKNLLSQPGVHIKSEIRDGVKCNIVIIRMPAVIQVYNYVKSGRRSNPNPTTENVMAYYGYQCQRADCAKKFTKSERKKLSKDHIMPTSRGGKDSWTNVTCLCIKCNNQKSDHTLEEMGWTLLRNPGKPVSKLEVQLAKRKDVPEEWLLEITE